jgi:hypothetical protein
MKRQRTRYNIMRAVLLASDTKYCRCKGHNDGPKGSITSVLKKLLLYIYRLYTESAHCMNQVTYFSKTV